MIGSILSTIGNLIGASVNNSSQEKMLDKQIDAQKELQENQNTWNEKMWNANNEYNSPQNQRSLYEDAGLNPAMFMSGSTANSLQSAGQTVSAPSPVNPPFDLSHIGSDAVNTYVAESQAQKNFADAGLTNEQRETERLIREWKVAKTKAEALLTEDERQKVSAEVDHIKAQKVYTDALTDMTYEQQRLFSEQADWLPLMNYSELQEVQSRITELLSRSKLNDAQRSYYSATLELVHEQAATERARQHNLYKQDELIDSEVSLNQNTEKYQNSQVGVNNSIAKVNNANAEGQNIENEVNRATMFTKKFQQNVNNTVGTFLDLAGKAVGIYADAKNPGILQQNADAHTEHANAASRNASSNETQAAASMKRAKAYEHAATRNPKRSSKR